MTWHVWEPSADGRPRLLSGQLHTPSPYFQQRILPFWDQYSQAMSLWSPCSRAFCYAARMPVPRLSQEGAGMPYHWTYAVILAHDVLQIQRCIGCRRTRQNRLPCLINLLILFAQV